MINLKKITFFLLVIIISIHQITANKLKETLRPIQGKKVPMSYKELWRSWNPRKEPLDTEVLHETEDKGVVIKVIRIRVGVFKGKKAMLACVYGYPKGTKKIPGLVQIHGEDHYADSSSIIANAKRGYATICIAWTGKIKVPGYEVGPDALKLFWEEQTDDLNYKISTNWGGIDAYHAPSRYKEDVYSSYQPSEYSIDKVPSPRNSGWFYATMAARRAITFLESEKRIIDKKKIGVYGHSMGAKVTILTTGTDKRVKTAVASCGGISDTKTSSIDPLLHKTMSDDEYLPLIKTPIAFITPSNGLYSKINDLQKAVTLIKSKDYRIICPPHFNKVYTSKYLVATHLWFDQHLKKSFKIKETPLTEYSLKTPNGMPLIKIIPDSPKEVLSVEVYYSERAEKDASMHFGQIKNKYWRFIKAKSFGKQWLTEIPTFNHDKSLWIYANVIYKLKKPVEVSSYAAKTYATDQYVISSRLKIVTAAQKKKSGIRASLKPSLVIEEFTDDWKKEWYSIKEDPNTWEYKTHRVHSDQYKAPRYAMLEFEIKSDQTNFIMLYANSYSHIRPLKGGDWEKVSVLPAHFVYEGKKLLNWKDIHTLSFGRFHNSWNGPSPEFRNLKWKKVNKAIMYAGQLIPLASSTPINNKLYLDPKYASDKKTVNTIEVDKWIDTKMPFVINDTTYDKGLSANTNNKMSYFLGGHYHKFHAIAIAGKDATKNFEVHLDGEKVFDSGLLKAKQSKKIEIPLSQSYELTLIIKDAREGNQNKPGAWVDAWIR